MTTVRVPVYGIADALPHRPSRLARRVTVFRLRVWPVLLLTLGLLGLLVGLMSWGEGTGPGGLGVALLGALLIWRGGRRLPGGWQGWVN